MLRAIFLLSFIVLVFAGIFLYTDKTANHVEQDIMSSVQTALSDKGLLGKKDTSVFITVNGRDVMLNGTTSSTNIRSHIEDTARSVSGVKDLKNNINIVSSKKDNKKGLSLSSALSPNKKEENKGNDYINNPVVIDVITCSPEVCRKAEKMYDKETHEIKD